MRCVSAREAAASPYLFLADHTHGQSSAVAQSPPRTGFSAM
jgi:hypothetical protein